MFTLMPFFAAAAQRALHAICAERCHARRYVAFAMFDAVCLRYAARCYAKKAAAFRSAEARRAHMRYASRRYAVAAALLLRAKRAERFTPRRYSGAPRF
jgi:hypothetical protein